MRPEGKTKSRQKLYQRIEGIKEITGAGGEYAVGSIDFSAAATAEDTIVVNGTYFEFQVAASEAAGTSAGTAADPHLITIGANVAATNASFAIALLAEDETTGEWGVIYPDDSVGVVDDATSKTTISFWPGVWANTLTMFDVSGLTDAPTATVQPGTASLGVKMPSISKEVNVNVIDTTGSASNQEYYTLVDGDYEGQEVKVLIASSVTDDTPTILGHLGEAGVAMVECEFITEEPGQQVTFTWTGSVWEMINYNTLLTVPDFTAAA